MSDGSINFDTKIDNEHFQDGIKDIEKKLNGVVNSIDKMSKTAKQAWDGMSSGQIALVNRIDQSKNKIDELKNKIAEIENQKVPTDEFSKLQQNIKKTEGTMNALLEKQRKMESTGINKKNQKKYQELQLEIKRVGNNLDELFAKEERLNNSGQAYKTVGVTDKSTILRNQLSSQEANFIKLNKQLEELKSKEERANTSGEKLVRTTKKLDSSAKSAGTSTKKMSKSMKESNISAGGLAKSLLKISTMIKARVLYSLVSGIVKGVKTGFNNLVQYSSKLNVSVSGLKSSFTQLNNSLATVFSPLVQSITPIIQTVIDKIIEAINVLAQFTARIFGNATTFTRAKKVNEDYAKSLDKTNKKQKQFASFDTVEQLTKKDDNDGSVEPSQMFEEAAINSDVINIVDTLKEKFNNLLNWLNSEFGSQLQSLWPDFGENIQNLKNIILNAWDSLKKLGSPISNWFNNDFLTFLHQFVDTAGTILNGLFETFNMVFDDIFNLVILPFLDTLFNHVLPFFTQLSTQITATLGTLFTVINMLFQTFWKEGIEPALKLIMKIWDDLWNSIHEAWKTWGESIFNNFRLAIENIGNTLLLVWDNFLKPVWDNFMNIIEELWNEHLKPLWDNILDFIGELINGALEIYNKFISPIVSWLVEKLGPVFSNVFNKIGNIVGIIIGIIIDAINGVITTLKGIIQFIVGIFTGDWEKAWEGIGNFFKGLWDRIVNIVKGAINLVIGYINGMIAALESGLNMVVDMINTLSFDVPEWVPGIGGQTWGFNIPPVNFGRIPKLATGTVLPGGSPYLAVVNDQPRGQTNVEAPLATIKQAVAEVLSELGYGNNGDTTVVLELDGNELGRAVYRLNKRESKRIGTSMRITGGAY